MATKKSNELSTVSALDESAATAVEAGAASAGTALTVVEQAPAAEAIAAHKTQRDVTHTMEKAMKTAEEFVSFGQGNLEAFAKSSQIWATGVQDLTKHMAAHAQAQMEQTVATMKAMAGVKSLKEAMDLQSTLARNSMEKAVAESSKITDASLKLAEQAMAPITARMSLAMEKLGRPV